MSKQFGGIKLAPRQYPPSKEDYERQAAAAARQAEEEQRRHAARKGRQHAVALSLCYDEEEDVFVDWDGNADLDGEPQPGSSSQQRGGQQQRSQTENVRRREEAWRAADQQDVMVSIACAKSLARYREEDVQLLVSATQQRIDAYVSTPFHACSGSLQRTGERNVLLRTLLGSGIVRVPRYCCTRCGMVELSPAAVGCQRSSPNPTTWFDPWLCSMAHHFTTSGGVAIATFCSCVDSVAAQAAQLSGEPRLSPCLSEKQLSAAVRHYTYVQRSYIDPARHGAAIFAGPLGHCPPCAGAMLAQDATEVPCAVLAEEPMAAARPLPAAINGADMLEQGAGVEGTDPQELEVAEMLAGTAGEPSCLLQLGAAGLPAVQAGTDEGSSQAGPLTLPAAAWPEGCSDAACSGAQEAVTSAGGNGNVAGTSAAVGSSAAGLSAAPAVAGFGGGRAFLLPNPGLVLPKVPYLPFLPGRRAAPVGHVRLRQRPLGINFDANVKNNHYQNCGRATTTAYAELTPLYGIYFGSGPNGADGLARRLISKLGGLQGEAGDGSDSGGCDAHLTCARPLASKTGGTTDIKCTVGSCCASHGVPLKGGFLSGETHEQFAHYVALLAVLVPLIPGVLAVLLDINCQFGKHLRANYPTIAAGLKFYIGWLHARAGHNISCQLEYSAVFQGGLGRCVGELIEQLWAFLKGVSRRARYMALPHREELLELALDAFAVSKNQRMHELLVQSWRHAQRRRVQLLNEREEVLLEGQQRGIALNPSETYTRVAAGMTQLDDGSMYVKKIAARHVAQQLSKAGGAVLAGLDGPVARALAVQGSPEYLRRLDADIMRLRERLGIGADQSDWEEGSDAFKAAAARLREAQLAIVQERVERQVSQLATLQEDRQAEVQSGHNSGLIRDKIRYRVRLIRQLMSEWEAWFTFQQDASVRPPRWEEADVFSNVLPWTEASAAQGVTADHLRFKLYCVQQELLRTEEELEYLPQDALNSLAYFQHQQQLLSSALQRCQTRVAEAAAPWEQQYFSGRVHILSSWHVRIGRLHLAAWKAFAKVGWVAPPMQ